MEFNRIFNQLKKGSLPNSNRTDLGQENDIECNELNLTNKIDHQGQ